MRVAVLGAGYAGLTVARRLERSLPPAADIVVVDQSSDHLLQHELHRVIRHPDIVEAITVPLENVLSRAEIMEATVTRIDEEAGVAVLDDETRLDYDLAAVCLGCETEFYDLNGVAEYATPLKSIADARSIRAAALDAEAGSAVVGGGGLSGIQAAGELAALSAAEDLDLDITLVEMEERVAPGFDETFAAAIHGELEARDVHVETGVAVESADEETVHLADGRSLSAEVFVWTGGIRGPAALSGKRRPAARTLRVSDSTFVVGDSAAITDEGGVAVPPSAQTAVRQAKVAADNICRLVAEADATADSVTIPVSEQGEVTAEPAVDADGHGDESLATYDETPAGWVVSIGDGAVAKVGPVVFSGEPAKAAKAAVGFGHLGSVGAIRQASELVAEELGWPTADQIGLGGGSEGKPVDLLPTDPASPGELGGPFTRFLSGFEDVLASPNPIDLTTITRQTDPSHPGSLAAQLRDSLSGSLGPAADHDDEAESIEIDVRADDSGQERGSGDGRQTPGEDSGGESTDE